MAGSSCHAEDIITRVTLLLGIRSPLHLSFLVRIPSISLHSSAYRRGLNCNIFYFTSIPIGIMVLSATKAFAFAALLCPFATSLNVPSTQVLRPRVPWKETGLWNHTPNKRQEGYPTSGGCNHGPSSRGCWHGEFDINTDMDESWPNTGKVVKVRPTMIIVAPASNNDSTTSTSRTRPCLQMASLNKSWLSMVKYRALYVMTNPNHLKQCADLVRHLLPTGETPSRSQ